MKKIILALCLLLFTGCATPTLWVSYQGWKDENNYVYNWSELSGVSKVDSKKLKEIVKHLEKENNFMQVIILDWKRFEK